MPNMQVRTIFLGLLDHQSQNFKKKFHIFDFEEHFGMKKILLIPIFIIFFQNPRKIVFKSVVHTWYFFFDLDREKIIFQGIFHRHVLSRPYDMNK